MNKEKNYEQLKQLADNRGAFIDWVLENHIEIIKQYLGFQEG